MNLNSSKKFWSTLSSDSKPGPSLTNCTSSSGESSPHLDISAGVKSCPLSTSHSLSQASPNGDSIHQRRALWAGVSSESRYPRLSAHRAILKRLLMVMDGVAFEARTPMELSASKISRKSSGPLRKGFNMWWIQFDDGEELAWRTNWLEKVTNE